MFEVFRNEEVRIYKIELKVTDAKICYHAFKKRIYKIELKAYRLKAPSSFLNPSFYESTK